ncbi:MAG: OmpH family outer membrane protein [Flavobacteriaceae bacterium]
MKRILCIGLVLAGMMSYAQQQVRVGFLDVNRVLEGLSEYQTSNAQLETKIALWKEEAETRQKQIDTLQKILDTEKPLLTQEIIEERTEDIAFEQEQLDAYKQKRFGPEGDWMAQKVIILQPVQDKILDAVREVADNRKLDYVFDRSAEILVFHSEKKYDISELVIRYIEQEDKKKAREELVESRKQEQKAQRNPAAEKRRQALAERKAERERKLAERKKQKASKKNKQATEAKVEVKREVKEKLSPEEKKAEREKILQQKREARIKALEARKKELEEKRKQAKK